MLFVGKIMQKASTYTPKNMMHFRVSAIRKMYINFVLRTVDMTAHLKCDK